MVVKVYVLLAMLVFAGVVMPIAHAQLGGLLGGLFNALLSVKGVVPCSIGGNSSNSSSVFPNADVQLRCGGNVVASTTTNSNGAFSIVVGLLPLVINLLGSCNITVTTPLASCNVGLSPTGFLMAPLNVVSNILGIITLALGDFSLVQNIN